jgi:hypothetical protein
MRSSGKEDKTGSNGEVRDTNFAWGEAELKKRIVFKFSIFASSFF